MKITKDFSTLIQREVVFAKTEMQGLNSNKALCHWRARLATCGQTDWGHVYQLTFAQPYSGWLACTRLMILLGLPAGWVSPGPAVLPWWLLEEVCTMLPVQWESLPHALNFSPLKISVRFSFFQVYCWILPNTHICFTGEAWILLSLMLNMILNTRMLRPGPSTMTVWCLLG